MTSCTATLAERTCSVDIKYHDHAVTGEGLKRLHDDSGVTWTDDAPGATPHEDPTPTYRVDRDAEHWIVTSGDNRIAGMVAWFDGGGDHPDPEGAADAHAEYLNGGGGPELAARVVLQRMHRVQVEADRYRRALTRIATTPPSDVVVPARIYARLVLDGRQP